ncbi:MAG: aldo/keto reductase [Ruminococcaceae bacterium]|nr:aldo/keto reductase [Oscillospiraceae bacterium]
MRAFQFPGTDLTVSALCFGTAGFGSSIDEKTAHSLLDAYTDAGGRMIDTARIYGGGVGEEIIGRWLRSGGRGKAVVATKGGHYDHRGPSVSRVTSADVCADVETSLRLLHLDAIDFYWLHRDNSALPVAEIAGFMNELVCVGKIRYWAISNWEQDRAAEAYTLGAKAVSNRFSLAKVPSDGRADQNGLVATDDEFYRFHRESGLPLVPYSALAFGFFEKLTRAGASVQDGTIVCDTAQIAPSLLSSLGTPENARRFQTLTRLCAETGRTVTDYTVGFHLAQPFPDIPVIAARTTDQLLPLLSACESPISCEELAILPA